MVPISEFRDKSQERQYIGKMWICKSFNVPGVCEKFSVFKTCYQEITVTHYSSSYQMSNISIPALTPVMSHFVTLDYWGLNKADDFKICWQGIFPFDDRLRHHKDLTSLAKCTFIFLLFDPLSALLYSSVCFLTEAQSPVVAFSNTTAKYTSFADPFTVTSLQPTFLRLFENCLRYVEIEEHITVSHIKSA